MKYAVIADIHANLPAFKAILEDAGKQGIDAYLILGDYFMCMPWVNETLALIQSIPNATVIPGNEDLYFDKCIGRDLLHPADAQFLAVYWAYQKLSEENRNYIDRLPKELVVSACGQKLYMAHGAMTYVLDTLEEGLTSRVAEHFKATPYSYAAYQQFLYETLEENKEFQERLKEIPKGIYLFGHSHLQWNYEKQGRIFINPGSCGFPLDGCPIPSYTILTLGDERKIEERRVSYDLTETVKQIKTSDLYAFAPEWCELVIREMEMGYEQIAFFLQYVKEYAEKKGDLIRPYRKETWREAFAEWMACV